ncbi:hypothetical protein DCAR_0416482 [Daucus carota subsp. sativus]|uniref:Uncharacterized protein n=1 Tax=Daucus carota subsp. sativus TaxID=79200 RepID=A0A162AB12_DAUCS|nr:hypothetical protein DCAR_0416482 [Daucus carota subsp. sativus]
MNPKRIYQSTENIVRWNSFGFWQVKLHQQPVLFHFVPCCFSWSDKTQISTFNESSFSHRALLESKAYGQFSFSESGFTLYWLPLDPGCAFELDALASSPQ